VSLLWVEHFLEFPGDRLVEIGIWDA